MNACQYLISRSSFRDDSCADSFFSISLTATYVFYNVAVSRFNFTFRASAKHLNLKLQHEPVSAAHDRPRRGRVVQLVACSAARPYGSLTIWRKRLGGSRALLTGSHVILSSCACSVTVGCFPRAARHVTSPARTNRTRGANKSKRNTSSRLHQSTLKRVSDFFWISSRHSLNVDRWAFPSHTS